MPIAPQRVYVALEQLESKHPLWGELDRLDHTERQLTLLGGKPWEDLKGAHDGYALSPLILPALPPGDLSGEQVRLRNVGRQQLADFAARLSEQQKRGIERRRAELLAVATAKQAQRKREAEAEIYAHARAIRERNAVRVANLKLRIGTLNSRIAIVPPPPDHALLATQRDALTEEWKRLRDEATDAEEAARRTSEAEQARLAQTDSADIEEQLGRVREESARTTEVLIQRQQKALEEELAHLTSAPIVQGNTAGPYQVETPSVGHGGGIMVIAAVMRIEKQRQSLHRFIRADIEAAVRDAAAAHNIQVTFDRRAAKVPDWTARFAEWIAGNLREIRQGTEGKQT